MKEIRELHLLGATGQVHTEMLNGREHLVVPVVALMEGVIHAVNAQTPEFVPLEVLKKGAASWDGKPVTLGHPRKDGKHCSANDPTVIASHGIGFIRKSRVEGKKFLCEALIDKLRTKELHADMYARLLDGDSEEVSVGALVITDKTAGEFNGRAFQSSWIETSGDHLAFLPGGRGACSLEMGCGTHRAAVAHLVTAEGFKMDPIEEYMLGLPGCFAFTVLEEASLTERIYAVENAVRNAWNDPPSPYAYTHAVFDDYVIVRKGEETWRVPYTVDKDGDVSLGTATKVKMAYVAASEFEACSVCQGKDKSCKTCEGKGQIRAAAGSRYSAPDKKMIQAVHDHAMVLGATCDRANHKTLEEKKKLEVHDPVRDYIKRIRAEVAGTR